MPLISYPINTDENTIAIKEETVVLANNFAEGLFNDTKYIAGIARMRNVSFSKLKQDHIMSKLAEVAVMEFLRSHGSDTTDVDFEIYSMKKKSFDADLICKNGLTIGDDDFGKDELKVSIKSYRSDTKYPPSFVFNIGQANNRTDIKDLPTIEKKTGLDNIFLKPDGYLFVGAEVDSKNKCVYIKTVTNFKDVLSLFGEPEKDSLKGIKACLYTRDLYAYTLSRK